MSNNPFTKGGSKPTVQPSTNGEVKTPGPTLYGTDLSDEIAVGGASVDLVDKLKLNETIRLAFLLFNPPKSEGSMPVPAIMYHKIYSKWYGQGNENNVLVRAFKNNPELDKAMTLVWDQAKMRFAVPVAQYVLDSYGNPQGVEVKVWRFGGDKYKLLKPIAQEWDLTQHDLLITCIKEQMQGVQINVARECSLSKVPAALLEELHTKAQNIWENELDMFFPKAQDESKIRQMLQATQVISGVPGQLMTANPFQGAPPSPAENPFMKGPANTPPATAFSDLVANTTQAPESPKP